MKQTWTTCSIVIIILGLVIILFCIAMLAGGYNGVFNAILQKKMQVKNGTEIGNIWENIPVPIVMKVYLFNITNPHEFEQGSAPKLQEIGPYVYREYHRKENITYEPNMTVTFYQKRTWVWDEESSGNLSLSDVVYTLNPIPVTAASTVEGNAFFLRSLNTVLNQNNEKVVVNINVSQILFDGYEDPVLDLMQSFFRGDRNSSLPFPPALKNYDKFAWFYKRNGSITFDGLFNMYTGESSLNDVGQINWWNYSNVTHFFNGSCNAVTGSAGELWPPGTVDQTYIQFFNPDLCMSPKLFYQQNTEDAYGNPGYRFEATNETFDEDCFCLEKSCISGLLDIHTCRMGAPALISLPHFWNGDPVLLQGVEGLNQDRDKHEFFIDINPDLGLPLQVAARIQINMKVKPYPGEDNLLHSGQIDILKSVPDVVLPILWFEVCTKLTDELSKEIQPALFFASSTVLIIFACVLIATVFGVGYCAGTNAWRAKAKRVEGHISTIVLNRKVTDLESVGGVSATLHPSTDVEV